MLVLGHGETDGDRDARTVADAHGDGDDDERALGDLATEADNALVAEITDEPLGLLIVTEALTLGLPVPAGEADALTLTDAHGDGDDDERALEDLATEADSALVAEMTAEPLGLMIVTVELTLGLPVPAGEADALTLTDAHGDGDEDERALDDLATEADGAPVKERTGEPLVLTVTDVLTLELAVTDGRLDSIPLAEAHSVTAEDVEPTGDTVRSTVVEPNAVADLLGASVAVTAPETLAPPEADSTDADAVPEPRRVTLTAPDDEAVATTVALTAGVAEVAPDALPPTDAVGCSEELGVTETDDATLADLDTAGEPLDASEAEKKADVLSVGADDGELYCVVGSAVVDGDPCAETEPAGDELGATDAETTADEVALAPGDFEAAPEPLPPVDGVTCNDALGEPEADR